MKIDRGRLPLSSPRRNRVSTHGLHTHTHTHARERVHPPAYIHSFARANACKRDERWLRDDRCVRGRTVDEPEQKAVLRLCVCLSLSLFSGRFYRRRATKTAKRKRERKRERVSGEREREYDTTYNSTPPSLFLSLLLFPLPFSPGLVSRPRRGFRAALALFSRRSIRYFNSYRSPTVPRTNKRQRKRVSFLPHTLFGTICVLARRELTFGLDARSGICLLSSKQGG